MKMTKPAIKKADKIDDKKRKGIKLNRHERRMLATAEKKAAAN